MWSFSELRYSSPALRVVVVVIVWRVVVIVIVVVVVVVVVVWRVVIVVVIIVIVVVIRWVCTADGLIAVAVRARCTDDPGRNASCT